MTKSRELFPPIKPYDKGFIGASGGHKIYFEQCGNPKGLPVLVFHGGPGAGCSPKDRRFPNPDKYRIVLFDQRGCGRSRPLANITSNTTWHLVQDAQDILDRLSISKTVVIGGSWGSTMAFVFSIVFPERVEGIVSRGIFLGEKSEIDYSEMGLIAQHFPESWERFVSVLPSKDRKNPLAGYYKMLIAKPVDRAQRRKLVYEWARFEDIHLNLEIPSDKTYDRRCAKENPKDIEAIAILEVYYLYNNCYMKNGFILNNVSRIPRNLPISIIHGKYDVICPSRSAHRLYKALLKHNVQLHWTHAGHSKTDPETQNKLLSEIDRIYSEITARR